MTRYGQEACSSGMPITRTLCACCCARSGAIGAGSLGPSVVSSRYNPVHCPAYHDSGLRSVGLAGRNPGGRNTPPSIAFHYLEEVSSCFEGLPARGASCRVVRMWNESSTKSTNSGIVPTRNEWSTKSTNSGIEPRTARCGGASSGRTPSIMRCGLTYPARRRT